MSFKVSVVLPIYLPSEKHRQMTDKCISLAKSTTDIKPEWVIVETGSQYYIDEADVYIHERERTTPNASINRGLHIASGDVVVFLANDVFVSDRWLDCLLDCFYAQKDCGLASLGTTEFNQTQKNEIIERVYFSVCMFKKKDAWLDPNYDNLFDDSDMIMRIYARGEKCYQNLNCIVEHKPHSTYGAPDLMSEKSLAQRRYFENKWQGFKDHPAYKLFA